MGVPPPREMTSLLLDDIREGREIVRVFSNTLIIHQVRIKEITTEKEVWIPSLN